MSLLCLRWLKTLSGGALSVLADTLGRGMATQDIGHFESVGIKWEALGLALEACIGF